MTERVQDLVILGAGGLAREVAFLVEEINRAAPRFRVLGFAEAGRSGVGRRVGKYSIHCGEDDVLEMNVAAAIGVGEPAIIQKIAERFESRPNVTFPNLVHPGTIWDEEAIDLGQGNIICAGSILTTGLRIGSFNYLNLACTYGHDVEVGSFSVINPGANISGGVHIGNGVLVGTGATILQYLEVGDRARVGAGAVVTRRVEPGTTVVGVPAREVPARDRA